ncbi:MAG: hypothetical protein RL156_1776 [Bacteroidota bacterium]|jgi:hypothetical protein
MDEAYEILQDCIIKLEHLADQPFIEATPYAMWCAAIAENLVTVLEKLDYE